MKTSENGRRFIEVFEGLFLHTYDDGTGVLTIGYGHTSAAGPPKVARGQTITEAQADQILSDDLAAVEKNVARCIKVPMTQEQFDALVSFDFNTGSLAKSSIDDKINAGNVSAAMATLLQYDHAGGRQMAGLTRRRQAERLVFIGQVNAGMKLAGTKPTNSVMPQQVERRPPLPPLATPKPTVMPPPPSITNPAPGSIGAFIASLFSIFKRKT